jgi:HlyD family secretion protein
MDGTVSKLDVELGERVVGTTQMTGTEMMRIARLDQMEMEVDVNENDVVNVSLGDSAAVEIDAYPGRVFRGTVTEIANSARTTGQGTQEQVTNFPVKIRILDPHNVLPASDGAGEVQTTAEEVPGTANPTPSFRPGMSGTVDVFTQTVFDAVAIPIQAVTVRDVNALAREAREAERRRPGAEPDAEPGAEPDTSSVIPEGEDLRQVIFLFQDGKAVMKGVETGISDDTHIVVLSGVEVGQKVITGPFRAVSRTLKPDASVEERKEGPGAPGGSES